MYYIIVLLCYYIVLFLLLHCSINIIMLFYYYIIISSCYYIVILYHYMVTLWYYYYFVLLLFYYYCILLLYSYIIVLSYRIIILSYLLTWFPIMFVCSGVAIYQWAGIIYDGYMHRFAVHICSMFSKHICFMIFGSTTLGAQAIGPPGAHGALHFFRLLFKLHGLLAYPYVCELCLCVHETQ